MNTESFLSDRSAATKTVPDDRSRAVAQAYVDMIHSVEQRCMAADGPVTPTHKEITDAELRAVYVLALDALGNPPR